MTRMIPMRGFAAAIARDRTRTTHVQAGGVRIGIDGDGPDFGVSIELTHADGTILTARLDHAGVDRLADILDQQMGLVGLAPHAALATVQ